MAKLTSLSPITEISGVGKARAEQLNRLGIRTVGDLVYFFPRAYENRSNVKLLVDYDLNSNASYILTIATDVKEAKIKKGLTLSKLRAFDETGACEIIFFNSPYVKQIFHVGETFRFWGKPVISKGRLSFTNPKYEPIIDGVNLADFVPIYPLTEGISSKQIDKLVKNAINDILPEIIDPIPDYLRVEHSLPTLTYALKNAHFPENNESLSKAMKRLAFDEMFYFALGISMSLSQRELVEGIKFSPCSLTPFTELLPYELTGSQKQAINDIYKDTVLGNNGKVFPMARIIVGDVGCGKTVCASAAAYIAAKSGYQTALMVPTEILARQHYKELSSLLGKLGLRIELLIGSTTAKDKKRIKEALALGLIDVIVGTHALITDDVNFSDLGLVITDEQHRFGVAQRSRLKEKSNLAHLLVMSATPIPRTMALTMYGDLNISRITEMPKGRQKVDTFLVNEGYRARLNDFISKQVELGGQCYIVCPSIERSKDENAMICDTITGEIVREDLLYLKHAVEFKEELQKSLPHLKIALLHGKMKAVEKDAVMNEFSSGNIDVLVSTTVIEVGVNVPNASLMIIENAERFGLSQLHQLRGRVGRGKRKSYCILVSDIDSQKSKDRLEIMKNTYDGYEIAEKDLKLRGPGDFFAQISDNNLRQSGGLEFKFTSMCEDVDVFNIAFSSAKTICKEDPYLSQEKHSELKRELSRRLKISSSNIS